MQVNMTCVSRNPLAKVKNWMILLRQSLNAHAFTGNISPIGVGRRRQSYPQRCYVNRLHVPSNSGLYSTLKITVGLLVTRYVIRVLY